MTQTMQNTDQLRFAGSVGLFSSVGLAVILAIHPLGSTELYGDGGQFLDHVNGLWIALHLAAATLLIAWPAVIGAWATHLATPQARFIGRMATLAATLGVGIGVIHLVGTDTMTFVAFRDTFVGGAGSEATVVGADLLLRLHASTLTAWVVGMFFALPLLLGWAAWQDGGMPVWTTAMVLAAAALQIPAIGITLAERQWTALSEMGLFRTGVTLLFLWMLITTFAMRKGRLAIGGDQVA